MASPRIAIIGFGFSGLMVTANLVPKLPTGSTLYIIANDLNARGLAYGTMNPEHLLNVPAAKMGAYTERLDDFYQWMNTANGAMAKQRLKLTRQYQADDFVPRALYAEYLSDIWQRTQENAAQQDCSIKLVETTATRIRTEGELAVLTERGDAIAVDKIVLAAGNEQKTILPQVKSAQIIQDPWMVDAFNDAANWASPVLIMGAGLTAVDTVLSLNRAGYKGEIIAFSRAGKWPHVHAQSMREFVFDKEALFAQKNLQQLMQYVRSKIKEAGEWRPVIDALRPYTQTLWQRLSLRDQHRFIRRLLSVWNIHRHRMSPEVKPVQNVLAVKKIEAKTENDTLHVTLTTQHGVQQFTPSRLINCTGGELNAACSSNALIKQALADGVLETQANGLGVAVDPHYRAWGAAHPNLYVIGSWMTGKFLESTAVPELRVQAARIAEQLGG